MLRVRRCLRTSSRLAPSRTDRSCDLPEEKTRDASNRRLPPNQTACTRTSCVPGSLRRLRVVEAPRTLRLRAVDRGIGRFTTSEAASADRHRARIWVALPCELGAERERFLPTALRAIEPLTPLSRCVPPSRLIRFRECCNLAARSSFEEFARVGGRCASPRSSSAASRERRRFVMVRDAFHR